MLQSELIRCSVMALCFGAAMLSLTTQRWSLGGLVNAAVTEPLRSQNVTLTPPRFADEQPAIINTANRASRQRTGPLASKLIIDLSDRQVLVYRANKIVNRYPIAIGQEGWETPRGRFKIENMMYDPIWKHPITREIFHAGPSNPLGNRWIGFWIDGENQIGFHGTNQPELIGQAVSHGCVRMYNDDIETLFDQVDIGTPVIVRR